MGRLDFDADRRARVVSRTKNAPQNAGLWSINGPAKRVLDLALTVPAILFLAPIFVLVAIIVKLDGGPILYRQRRVGRYGTLFTMYKFRSMRVDADAVLERLLLDDPHRAAEWHNFQKLQNDPRITTIGRIIRKSSIDELPQLFNIVRGDMSLVGQRPILPSQRDAYGEHIFAYELARPGLTGLWQISGRNALSFQRRAELGSLYVEEWTLSRDIDILLRTIPTVLTATTETAR
ncbi:MAG: sugar transferase [Pseudomonadota bacterium]